MKLGLITAIIPSDGAANAAAHCLEGAKSIWSSWPGYLKPGFGRTGRSLESRGLKPVVAHTSGHAKVIDLQRLATSLDATKVVPIHTNSTRSFQSLFERVKVKEEV